RQGRLEATAAELRSAGAGIASVRADVSSAADVERLADETWAKFGGAHLLFNNAGIAAGGGFVWEASLKDWQWVLGVNLMGVVHGIRSFVPLMLKQDCECHVVNTASAAGLVSAPLMAAYNASKHGVVTVS